MQGPAGSVERPLHPPRQATGWEAITHAAHCARSPLISIQPQILRLFILKLQCPLAVAPKCQTIPRPLEPGIVPFGPSWGEASARCHGAGDPFWTGNAGLHYTNSLWNLKQDPGPLLAPGPWLKRELILEKNLPAIYRGKNIRHWTNILSHFSLATVFPGHSQGNHPILKCI